MQFKRITPQEAHELLGSGDDWIYLDVRSRLEFESGHIPGAKCVPLLDADPGGRGLVPNPDFLEQVTALLGKDTRVIVGCRRGPRSLRAAQMLLEEGYENLVEMRGGYDGELGPGGQVAFAGWSRCGLPTESGPE